MNYFWSQFRIIEWFCVCMPLQLFSWIFELTMYSHCSACDSICKPPTTYAFVCDGCLLRKPEDAELVLCPKFGSWLHPWSGDWTKCHHRNINRQPLLNRSQELNGKGTNIYITFYIRFGGQTRDKIPGPLLSILFIFDFNEIFAQFGIVCVSAPLSNTYNHYKIDQIWLISILSKHHNSQLNLKT